MNDIKTIEDLKPNNGKNLTITTPFGGFNRYPVRTHVISDNDKMIDVVGKYVKDLIGAEDFLFISEKIVAITQGRAFRIDEIHPSLLARVMCKFVHKSPYGIGIGSPETMELCLRDVGRLKVIFAAIVAAICKLFGKKGVFYDICGDKARAIDGPCDFTIPPYNNYAKLAPDKPDDVAREISESLGGNTVIVIDANDLGVNVLGKFPLDFNNEIPEAIFKDNPLDQADQQTPMAIVRRVEPCTD
ncbi:MAG: coenzyme F420-0:L-glutamate ligase [Ruminococcus sp.]|jgi:F420-0:gamma-glutamyl ligase-like protein|nr:coenzyme F420-0:L-glutamate ligase [Ruminococcus sp.]